MFKGILNTDLKAFINLLKKQLAEDFQIKTLIDSSGRLSELACHTLCLNVLKTAKTEITEYYTNKAPKNLNALTKALDTRDSEYKSLLLIELYSKIKSTHCKLIQKNLPKTLNLEILKKKIKIYSDRPQKGIDKHAVVTFLSTCVFMYRSQLNCQPLERLITFFEKEKKALEWLKYKILDEAIRTDEQFWPIGNHEWIPRHLILDVLKRSAGMIEGITPFVVNQTNEDLIIIDWLIIHSDMRSPIQHLYFKNTNNTVCSGHMPAIRLTLEGTTSQGVQTTGSDTFHKALRNAFYNSTNPRSFIRKMNYVEQDHLISGKKHLKPTKTTFFTVEGIKTNNEKAINQIRHEKIRPQYKERRAMYTLFSNLSINGDEGNDILSFDSDETEYSTDEKQSTKRIAL